MQADYIRPEFTDEFVASLRRRYGMSGNRAFPNQEAQLIYSLLDIRDELLDELARLRALEPVTKEPDDSAEKVQSKAPKQSPGQGDKSRPAKTGSPTGDSEAAENQS